MPNSYDEAIVTILHQRDVYQIRVDRIGEGAFVGGRDYFIARTGVAESCTVRAEKRSRHETKNGALSAGFDRIIRRILGEADDAGLFPYDLVVAINGALFGMNGAPTNDYLLRANADPYSVDFGRMAYRSMFGGEVTRGHSMGETFAAAFAGILEGRAE